MITGVQKSTKTKTVRIISPHYSRNKEDYGISGIISPPPPTNADSPSPPQESSPTDPFGAQSDDGASQDDDEDLRRNTIANTAPIMPQNPMDLRMPSKPSKKAPALQFGADSSTIGSPDKSDPAASTAVAGRPLYDVDDFKRLLLTGEKLRTDTNMPTTPPAQVHALKVGDSKSNTGVSPVSRQSIFEPQPELQPESPSISKERPPSGEERRGLVQPSPGPTVAQSRPSVPPSRHGKLVKPNMPQTVSFESLSSSPPDRDPTLRSPGEPLSPASPWNTTHLNKPLPPPPKSESLEAKPALSATRAEEIERSLPPTQHSSRATAKPSPPVVPTARRHGQGRSRSSTNDSNRSTSLSEDLSQYTHPSSSSSSLTASKPPPIPPPRRAGTAPDLENSGPASNVGSSFSGTESPHFKPRPPAPPSRTPSTTSIRRTSRTSTASGSSGAAAAPAPPAPPAPRRRGSSQSQISFTPSGLSGEYRFSSKERPRTDSGASSTQETPMAETHAESKDLVGDLTALQREVDELRGKFGR